VIPWRLSLRLKRFFNRKDAKGAKKDMQLGGNPFPILFFAVLRSLLLCGLMGSKSGRNAHKKTFSNAKAQSP
jgi:hypothetical protein